ncbi:MAG TPA: hypothetical protein VL049_11205 [Candidatus Dormibacteraeota bacterium]|nr:hypothetical protein [Candidatus Dormibacteraeota bacterium]
MRLLLLSALPIAVVCGAHARGALAQTPPPPPAPIASGPSTPASTSPFVPISTRPAYEIRAEAAEARYRAYTDRLRHYYDALCAHVQAEAPDLYPKLQEAPPKPVVYGYQILPKLLPLPTPGQMPAQRPRATSKWYSWPWTEQKIDTEMKKLDAVTAVLDRVATLPPADRHPVYEKLVDEYPGLPAAERNIDDHVQYNRTWQADVVRRRAMYDTNTHLHDAVLERQAILDALDARDDGAFAAALKAVPGVDTTCARAGLEPQLRAREAALAREIHDVIDEVDPPKHLRLEQPSPHVWIVRVPFVTDIDDAEFVAGVRRAIESLWYVQDGGDEFRVELSFTHISPDELYRRRAGCESGGGSSECRPPKKGDKIDVGRHVGLFPRGAAVLTTGSNMTYVWGGAIVLGPEDAGPHLLAHEFGHMLGFRDEYFRGYRDLGADGFLMMEVVAEPDDVMGGAGPVRRHQFERLIAAAQPQPAAVATKP